MSANIATRALKLALVTTGLIFIFLIYPLGLVWPSGWCWGHGPSHCLTTILSVYATPGAFLIAAARDPLAHRSLIWFAGWSSAAHGGVLLASLICGITLEGGPLCGRRPPVGAWPYLQHWM